MVVEVSFDRTIEVFLSHPVSGLHSTLARPVGMIDVLLANWYFGDRYANLTHPTVNCGIISSASCFVHMFIPPVWAHHHRTALSTVSLWREPAKIPGYFLKLPAGGGETPSALLGRGGQLGAGLTPLARKITSSSFGQLK
jgi:hypothetical protein